MFLPPLKLSPKPHSAAKMGQDYFRNRPPSAILNYLFMSTLSAAAKSLLSIAGTSSNHYNTHDNFYYVDDDLIHDQGMSSWKLRDHFNYLLMLMIWVTLWFLRVLMDYFPSSLVPFPQYLLDGFSAATVGSSSPSPSSDLVALSSFCSPPSSAAAAVGGSHQSSPSLDLVLRNDGSCPSGYPEEESSTKAIGRALSHIFGLLNELPATSRKYQFAVSMADKIVDDNVRDGHVALQEINRTALSSAFQRTLALLYRSLQSSSSYGSSVDDGSRDGTWTSRVISSVPLGSYIYSGLRFCVTNFFPALPFSLVGPGGLGGGGDTYQSQRMKQLAIAGDDGSTGEWVLAEKLAQELLWIVNKMKVCSVVEEAMVQWSYASGLAALSLYANHRVQGVIVRITALLLGELVRGKAEEVIPRQVKFRLLLIWMPLFCYAGNGVAYPVLTGCEKAETERVMEQVLSGLPAADQEIILTNWFQDYTTSASDWPNLQHAYDCWCRSSRSLLLN